MWACHLPTISFSFPNIFPVVQCSDPTLALLSSEPLSLSHPSHSQPFMSVEILGPEPTNVADFGLNAAFDPSAETADDKGDAGDYVHIRVQQRNGRKSLTTVQGLKEKFDYDKVLKALKKDFCCNGNVVEDTELGKVIQLQGDQRRAVSEFLVKKKLTKKENIKLHGF